MPRTADSVPASNSSSTECTISRRGLRPTSGRRPPHSPTRTPAPTTTPAPVGSTARSGAIRASASRLSDSATPGSVRPRPDHQTCAPDLPDGQRLQRQRGVVERTQTRAATTMSTGAPRSRAMSRSVTPLGTDLDQQTAGALDQGEPAGSVHRGDHVDELRPVGNAEPARCAAASRRQRFGKPCQRHVIRSLLRAGTLRRGRRRRRRSRSAPACTPRRRCPPAWRGTPAPRWRRSCRRRCSVPVTTTTLTPATAPR